MALSQKKRTIAFWLVVLLAAVGQLTNTIFVPAMNVMASSLHVSPGSMQAIIAAYLLAYGLSQFIYGPLSDYFGRRPVVLTGLILYLPGAVLAWHAHSFLVLFLGCLIQGTGIGCSGVMARTVMRDLFSGKALHRANSLMMMALVLPPLIAPVIGGQLSHLFNWRACFIFLTFFGFFCWLICMFIYPETNKHKGQSDPVLQKYAYVINNKAFQIYSLCTIQTFAGIAVLEAALGVLLGNRLALDPSTVSHLFIIPLPGYLLGSWLSGKLAQFISRDSIMLISLVLLTAGGFTMLIPGIMNCISIALLIIPATIYFIAAGMLAPAATTGATDPFPKLAGTAGAILGGLQNIGAGLITFLSAWLPQNNQLCLGILMTLLAIIASFILCKHLVRQRKTLITLAQSTEGR